jgi:hypothetical protein
MLRAGLTFCTSGARRVALALAPPFTRPACPVTDAPALALARAAPAPRPSARIHAAFCAASRASGPRRCGAVSTQAGNRGRGRTHREERVGVVARRRAPL